MRETKQQMTGKRALKTSILDTRHFSADICLPIMSSSNSRLYCRPSSECYILKRKIAPLTFLCSGLKGSKTSPGPSTTRNVITWESYPEIEGRRNIPPTLKVPEFPAVKVNREKTSQRNLFARVGISLMGRQLGSCIWENLFQ